MNVLIQNLFHNFCCFQLNADNQVVGSNIGRNDLVQLQWVDAADGTATLYLVKEGIFITVNAADEVVGSAKAQLFQLLVQKNGSYIIHVVGDTTRSLVLDKVSGPITNGPTPPAGAADFDKQCWMLVAP